MNSWGQPSVMIAFTWDRTQEGNKVGITNKNIQQNTQARSFGKNERKMINVLPCVSLPLVVSNGCIS